MLYYLKPENRTQLARVKEINLQGAKWTEKDLEDLLAENIESLIRADQLFVIAQERPRQEQADIMALDRDGTLYLFEMKRWKSNEENLLQVLRYGQRYGRYDYDRLNNLFQSYLHRKGTADRKPLAEAHKEYFELDESLQPSRINLTQKFIIVTNGLDRPTREAIEYWKKYTLPVEALVYRVYQDEPSGAFMIDFDPYGPHSDISENTGEGLYVVNTNITYEPQAYKDMLNENKASAYGSKKHLITNIHKGSRLCLYHNAVGVIAIGRVKSEYMKTSFDGAAEDEYFVKCEFDYKFDPVLEREMAVSASEINQHFNTGHCFRQTIFTLPADYDKFIHDQFAAKSKRGGKSRNSVSKLSSPAS